MTKLNQKRRALCIMAVATAACGMAPIGWVAAKNTAAAPGGSGPVQNAGLSTAATSNSLYDNFTADTGLNTGLWEVNGPVATAALVNNDSPRASMVAPSLSFTPSQGLVMNGVNGGYLQGGIQSIQSFTGPFDFTTTVTPVALNSGAFQVTLSNSNGGSGVGVYGGIGGSSVFTGVWYSSPSGPGTYWQQIAKLSPNAPQIGTAYTVNINVDSGGLANISVAAGGTVIGQGTDQIGTGPFYAILSQGSGAFSSGPDAADWQAVSVTTPHPTPPPTAMLVHNFFGANQTESLGYPSPPDVNGAAGPNSFAEFLNGSFTLLSKAGSVISTISDSTFWQSAKWSKSVPLSSLSSLTDPRILYDPATGHWFATELTNANPNARSLLLGVSATSDPSGNWKAYQVSPSTGENFDYTTMGINSSSLFVGVNDTASPYNAVVYQIGKTGLINGSPSYAQVTLDSNSTNSNALYTAQPVVNLNTDQTPDTFIAEPLNSQGVDANILDAVTETKLGAELVSVSVPSQVAAASNAPITVAQPGSTTQLETDAGDKSVTAAPYEVNNIRFSGQNVAWLAQTVESPTDSANAAIKWYEISLNANPAQDNVIQSGIISDTQQSDIYPSIAANQDGSVVIGFTRVGSGSGQYASAYAVVGTTSNGVTTFGQLIQLQAGTSPYNNTSGTARRWGDESQTSIDPTDPSEFWTVQEYAQSGQSLLGTQSIWGTKIADLMPNVGWDTTTGDFGNPANWYEGIPPGSSDPAIFQWMNNGAILPRNVNFTADEHSLALEDEGADVTLNLAGHTYSLVPQTSGIAGQGSVRVGWPTTGLGSFLDVKNGNLVSTTGIISPYATIPGANDAVILNSATWNNSGDISVGNGGTGLLQIDSASSVNTGSLTIAPASSGEVELAGNLNAAELTICGGGSLRQTGGITKITANLTNAGTIAISGGSFSANSVTNTGSFSAIGAAVAITGPVSNMGTWVVSGAQIHYGGTFTNNGEYSSDPSTSYFADLVVGSRGYINAATGDAFVVSGDYSDQSSENSLWNTRGATLEFAGGGSHRITVSAGAAGGTFAWGDLTVASGNTLIIGQSGVAPVVSIYFGTLDLQGGKQQIQDITLSGVNLFYNPSSLGNSYLDGRAYTLAGGGLLEPGAAPMLPEPAGLALLAVGGLGLVLRKRRAGATG